MAINAARGVRESGTAAHIKMITNLPIRGIRLRGYDVFDEIAWVDCDTESNRWVKTRIIDHAAGAKNVLLDCDVEVLAPLNPLMALLDSFDVAARNLPTETGKKFTLSDGAKIKPMSLSEINTGVIFFSETAGARELFDGWPRNFLNMGQSRDQLAFLNATIHGG
jgi:hypothetical protein